MCPGSGTYGSAPKSWIPDSGDPDECPPRRLTADLRYSAWVLLYVITRLRKGLHVPSVQVGVSLVGSSRGNIAEAHSILCEKTQNQLKIDPVSGESSTQRVANKEQYKTKSNKDKGRITK